MKRMFLVILMLLITVPAFCASPLRVYVGEFNAVGVQAKDDTRVMLQSLLASRLSSDNLLSVGSAAEADLIVAGTYISISKQYNIDAVARTASGQTVTRTFVQGEGGQDALFAATAELAKKLTSELVKLQSSGAIPVAVKQPAALPQRPASNDIVRVATPVVGGDLQRTPQGDIVRPQAFYRGSPNKGDVLRLDGKYNLLAIGPTNTKGKRVLFIAQNHLLKVVNEDEGNPVGGFELPATDQIVAIDYVDGDGNGSPELYVTIVRLGEVSSQVWEFTNNKLVKIASDLPYFFRAISLAGGATRLYAQEQGRAPSRYYGDVYEVELKGKKIIKKTRHTMPRYGNIYSFNQFKHANGELLTVVYHENNYLIVYDKEQHELWRSNETFGGSELFYQVEDLRDARDINDRFLWFFMNQRILVTSKQEVLVGKNDGFWVLGNARMYKKGAVYCLYWNGAALEEVWRTKDTQNYMPDFAFDETKSELLLLQLTQREDVLLRNKGASALQIKKVE